MLERRSDSPQVACPLGDSQDIFSSADLPTVEKSNNVHRSADLTTA